ncbi:restriction endonuclease subunit S [Pasteurella multocida]
MANINILQMIEQCQVEWKTLGEVAEFRRGSFPQPYGESEWYGGEDAMPFVQVVDVGEDMKLVDDTKNKISKLAQPKSVFVPQGSVIVTLQGSIGRVAITQYDAYVDRTLAIFEKYKIDIDKKYFAYQLEDIFKTKKQNARGSTIKTITKQEFSEFQIPIPRLPIQKEIVKILDKFTELEAALEAALEAELSLREKQYTFYRDHLLSFGDDVEWKSLGEVAQYSSTRIKFDLINKHNYVGVDNLLQNREGKTVSNYVPTSGNLTQFTAGDILIGNIRPYLKKIWQADCEGGTNGDVLVIRIIDKNVDTRYLYQVLADDKFFEYNMKHAKGAKMPRGNKQAILQYKIPIPPLTTQQKIVAILDKFETLTHSITEGLPKEIELRRKQYEYYREKLLTFPKQ